MAKPVIFAHWDTLIENFQCSSVYFYGSLEQAIKKRQVPDCRIERVTGREGGWFSSWREYIRVRRKEYLFDICAAPFGSGYFISWWLGEMPPGCLSIIPFVGFFMRKSLTYYRLDTALMFMQAIHNAVLEVIDTITKPQGIRALSELERKPILKDFYK